MYNIEKVLESLSSAHESGGQKRCGCVYNFVQYNNLKNMVMNTRI